MLTDFNKTTTCSSDSWMSSVGEVIKDLHVAKFLTRNSLYPPFSLLPVIVEFSDNQSAPIIAKCTDPCIRACRFAYNSECSRQLHSTPALEVFLVQSTVDWYPFVCQPEIVT